MRCCDHDRENLDPMFNTMRCCDHDRDHLDLTFDIMIWCDHDLDHLDPVFGIMRCCDHDLYHLLNRSKVWRFEMLCKSCTVQILSDKRVLKICFFSGNRVCTPLPGGSAGLSWQWLNYLAGISKWKIAACGQERQKKRETRVSHVCGHNHPRSTHIYDDGDVSYGSLCLSTNSNVPRSLRVDQQQRSSMVARKLSYVLYKCYDGRPNPFVQ